MILITEKLENTDKETSLEIISRILPRKTSVIYTNMCVCVYIRKCV